jgi:hypothetical protein
MIESVSPLCIKDRSGSNVITRGVTTSGLSKENPGFLISKYTMGSESAPTSVKEIWEKTIVRFHERTGQKLDGVSRGPDDLQTLLDAHYAAEADDKSVSQAKAVGFQMIHCIQLLGGIASQGASMVRGNNIALHTIRGPS